MMRSIRNVLLLACFIVPVVEAQELSWRVVLGPTAEWRPNVYWGAEVRELIGDGSVTFDSMGVRHIVPSKFEASAMGLIGVTGNKNERGEHMLATTGQGQIGVLYRAGDNMRIGAYAAAVAYPLAYGALARVEPMSAVAVQFGVLRRRDTNVNGGVFQLDVALAFLEDLFHGGAH